MSGSVSYHKGVLAEDQVARRYYGEGYFFCARRWRGKYGEIDIILRKENVVVFAEVKCAKTHQIAAERLTHRQIKRIWACANEFLATEPYGFDAEYRFDVALVDAQGKIEIVENAIAA